MSELIKTRAKYIDTEDSAKQTPILQMQRPLPNTIRLSRDCGRDNPFRPGSAIYKSADPIVDYYKNGQASRPQSPADLNSLIDSKASDDKTAGHETDTGRSCWRKYVCCCLGDKCYRCCCCKRSHPKPKTKRPGDDLDRQQAKESASKNTLTIDQDHPPKATAKILVTNHDQDSADTTQAKRVQIETSASKQSNKCTRTRNKSQRCVIS